jgi:hypothetical protein
VLGVPISKAALAIIDRRVSENVLLFPGCPELKQKLHYFRCVAVNGDEEHRKLSAKRCVWLESEILAHLQRIAS